MRIAFFTDSYRPTHDGVAQFVGALADALGRQGHQVRVFTSQQLGTPRRVREGNVEVRRHRSLPMPFYPDYRWSIWPYNAALRSTFGSMVDVVHVHTPGPVGTAGVLAAHRHQVPLVGTFHTNLKDMQTSLPDRASVRTFFWAAWWWNAGVYARCDRVTAPAQPAKELLESSFTKPDLKAPIEVVPNGVDTRTFRPGILAPDWGMRLGASGLPRILFLGRLTKDKGIHTFLDAVDLLPRSLRFLALVGGDGPEREAVEERIAREPGLQPRVRYLGRVPEEDKPSLLSQARVFVLPSQADTSSIAVLEAMASGAACVVTNRGGPRALVREGVNGLLIDPDRPDGLAAALQRVLEDDDLQRRLGWGGVEYVQREASIDRTASELVGVYERVRGAHGALSRPG